MELLGEITSDGCVELRWRAPARAARSFQLLIVRTGAVPAFTSLLLDGQTRRYRIEHLSRHQRYLVMVLAPGGAASRWLSVTPRAGLAPVLDERRGLEDFLARPRRFVVMPQARRLTAYWSVTAGFVDRLRVELRLADGEPLGRLELEPEVSSLSLDAERGLALENGRTYVVRLETCFAGQVCAATPAVRCVPAPQGEERRANAALPQERLIYPSVSLAPEVRIFDDEDEGEEAQPGGTELRCCHCQRAVSWQDYRLLCSGCGAEFIPNGRGEYLELGSLRFGTCRCCLPRKILIMRPGEAEAGSLRCAHSGKEHIRMPGSEGHHLIEDLPHGLCQCCRPRRPLVRRGQAIRCSRSDEVHRNQDGRYVLVPSQPVFDAAAIDELLDAGLAEICSTGVSSARRASARR
jgi:hypothetical protein